MSIELLFEDERWPEYLGEVASQVEDNIFDHFLLDVDDFETTILFTDDASIRALNREFRQKDKPTNILSWPSAHFNYDKMGIPELPKPSDGPFPTVLGDMALGFETCQREAKAVGELEHLAHLLTHGFLHLFGYDHVKDNDAAIMQSLEIEILNRINIKNPY